MFLFQIVSESFFFCISIAAWSVMPKATAPVAKKGKPPLKSSPSIKQRAWTMKVTTYTTANADPVFYRDTAFPRYTARLNHRVDRGATT